MHGFTKLVKGTARAIISGIHLLFLGPMEQFIFANKALDHLNIEVWLIF